MMSGSSSRSFRDEMHGVPFCSEAENMELKIVAEPTSHGSIRIVNEPGNRPGDESGATGGEKTSRNVVSPFNALTVSDMLTYRKKVQRQAKRMDESMRKPGVEKERPWEDNLGDMNMHSHVIRNNNQLGEVETT